MSVTIVEYMVVKIPLLELLLVVLVGLAEVAKGVGEVAEGEVVEGDLKLLSEDEVGGVDVGDVILEDVVEEVVGVSVDVVVVDVVVVDDDEAGIELDVWPSEEVVSEVFEVAPELPP